MKVSLGADSGRRRVLMAMPFPPARDSLHGGGQSTGRLVDELADSHELAVVYFRAENEPSMESALAERCALVREVRRPAGIADPGRILKLLWAFLRGNPMWVADWQVAGFREILRKICEEWKPDVVHFEFHVMGQYADAAAGRASVLVDHEPGAAAARDRWQFSRGWRRPVLARDAKAWQKYEVQCLGKFGAVVCLTERDRKALLQARPSTRVEVIASRGPLLLAPAVGVAQAANTILFVGNYGHPPNVDAALRLAEVIFPRVKARHPGAVLQIVGAAPPEWLVRLAAADIVVTGRVPDVAPWLASAAIVVVPLRMGGGLRVKVMDALYAAKATVASRLATEGLNVRHNHELVIAETDEEFVDALCLLLDQPSERQRLSDNARAWAETHATPGRVRAAFARVYDSVVGEAGVANRGDEWPR